jgi:hypothetical protein
VTTTSEVFGSLAIHAGSQQVKVRDQGRSEVVKIPANIDIDLSSSDFQESGDDALSNPSVPGDSVGQFDPHDRHVCIIGEVKVLSIFSANIDLISSFSFGSL